jgi:hypothetical protein
MNRVKMFLSLVAVVVAVSASIASQPRTTEVWRRPTDGGMCAATSCLLSANISCADSGYSYFNNSSCDGSTITPKKN